MIMGWDVFLVRAYWKATIHLKFLGRVETAFLGFVGVYISFAEK